MQEAPGDYREYSLSGTPEEIGRQAAAYHRGWDGPATPDLTTEQVTFARACAAEVERAHPPILRELTAWAGTCGLPLDSALFYLSVGMTEKSKRGRSRRAPDPEARGCSTVGVMTADGPVVGRNFDLYYRVATRHLISTGPEGFLSHAGMYDGLVAGRTDGMNSSGLFVSLHTVRAKPPARRNPGMFCVHLVRAVLETCKTAREAAERLQEFPHISSFNYFLADREEMLVVEAHPERTCVREAENGVLACANHYVHPGMGDFLYAVPPNSAARLDFLLDGVACLASECEPSIAALMGDHSVPVCGHTETMATLWSAIAVPALLKVSYCLGAPCRNDYSHVVSLA